MRPLHSFLIVLTLAVGAALGVMLWQTSRATPEVASAAPDRSSGPERAAPAGQATEIRDAGPALAPAAEREARVASSAPAAPLTAGSAASDTPRSGVRVRGRVVDENGAPVARARVLAAEQLDFGVAGMPLDARSGLFGGRERSEVRTAEDGSFVFDSLDPGLLSVAVRAAGFAPLDRSDIAVPKEAEFELAPLQVEPGAILRGRVIDSGGRPVAGAVLERFNEAPRAELGFGMDFGMPVGESAADGTFVVDVLAVGPWALRAATDEHPDGWLEGETTLPGQRVEGLLLALEDGFAISGQVVDVPAGEASNLSVRARSVAAAPEAATPTEIRRARPRTASLAADGSFAVRGLRAGEHELQLERSYNEGFLGFLESGLSEKVRAHAGDRAVRLVYRAGAALSMQVVDRQTQRPIESFKLSAGIEWRMPQLDDSGDALLAHPDGRARVEGLRPREGARRASIEVEATGYARAVRTDIEVREGEETDLGRIELEPMPLCVVRVVDASSGRPVEGARVTLAQEDPEPPSDGRRVRMGVSIGDDGDIQVDGSQSSRAQTDVEGVARLTSFVGHSSRLRVSHPAFAPWASDLFIAPEGNDEHDVRLGPGGAVAVHVLDSDGNPMVGARVETRPAGGSALAQGPFNKSTQVSDAEGEARFEHLAPGAHEFRAQPSGHGGAVSTDAGDFVVAFSGGDEKGWIEAAVSEGGLADVEIVVPRSVALFGMVREGGEPLAGANVRLSSLSAGADDPSELMLGMSTGRLSARTDGQGRYRIEGVEPGDYTMEVRHRSRAMPAEMRVTLREVDVERDVDLGVSIVEGTVRDEAGEPLAGVRVHAERAEKDDGKPRAVAVRMIAFAGDDGAVLTSLDSGAGKDSATTDEHGRYVLRGVLDDVDLQVLGEGADVQPGRSEAFRSTPEGKRTGVDLVLKAGGKIEVTARQPDGSPAKNIMVTAQFEGQSESGMGPKVGMTKGDGRVVLDGLKPGTWRITSQVLGPNQDGAEIPASTVEVKPGETATLPVAVP